MWLNYNFALKVELEIEYTGDVKKIRIKIWQVLILVVTTTEGCHVQKGTINNMMPWLWDTDEDGRLQIS